MAGVAAMVDVEVRTPWRGWRLPSRWAAGSRRGVAATLAVGRELEAGVAGMVEIGGDLIARVAGVVGSCFHRVRPERQVRRVAAPAPEQWAHASARWERLRRAHAPEAAYRSAPPVSVGECDPGGRTMAWWGRNGRMPAQVPSRGGRRAVGAREGCIAAMLPDGQARRPPAGAWAWRSRSPPRGAAEAQWSAYNAIAGAGIVTDWPIAGNTKGR
jgi:hypothetical protein